MELPEQDLADTKSRNAPLLYRLSNVKSHWFGYFKQHADGQKTIRYSPMSNSGDQSSGIQKTVI